MLELTTFYLTHAFKLSKCREAAFGRSNTNRQRSDYMYLINCVHLGI